MKRRIALTGGIGSGKSYVSQLLRSRFGIAVYDCDQAAKQLMATNEQLRSSLRQLVGPKLFDNEGVLQKRVLANYLLASEANKQAVNNVVHPAVAAHFEQSGYEWLESAILFESGFHKRTSFSAVVCVAAPTPVRVERIVRRDGISTEKALQWINAQMPQAEVMALSDFVINNDGTQPLLPQIEQCVRALCMHGEQEAGTHRQQP